MCWSIAVYLKVIQSTVLAYSLSCGDSTKTGKDQKLVVLIAYSVAD